VRWREREREGAGKKLSEQRVTVLSYILLRTKICTPTVLFERMLRQIVFENISTVNLIF
jgi:hypothetical protein